MRWRSSIRRSHGIFLEEPHRRVERRAAPHLEAEQVRQPVGDRVGDGQHVVGAHARGEQRLVRVAHRRVGDQQPLLVADPLRELLGPELEQLLPHARPVGG